MVTHMARMPSGPIPPNSFNGKNSLEKSFKNDDRYGNDENVVNDKVCSNDEKLNNADSDAFVG